jgi:hypothetical protein
MLGLPCRGSCLEDFSIEKEAEPRSSHEDWGPSDASFMAIQTAESHMALSPEGPALALMFHSSVILKSFFFFFFFFETGSYYVSLLP